MFRLKVRPQASRGLVHDITPESAGWTHVGFALHRLAAGEGARGATETWDVCLVHVSERARFRAGRQAFRIVGERMSPFAGAPDAVYVPMGAEWSVEAETPVELAVCSAPGAPGYAVRRIAPGAHGQTVRGKDTHLRHVTDIMPENDGAARSLLVVEVITPGGHTSSFPPHNHDQDALPNESDLKETYDHRFNPPQGFAVQRVYTDHRSVDEAMAVENGDVSLVPGGYHPVAAIHGCDSDDLNVMAGPKRAWNFHNAKEYACLSAGI